MIDIGLTSVTFRNLNCSDIINYSSKCGLSCIEWGSDVHVPENNFENAKEVAQKTTDSELYVSSYGSYYRVGEYENPTQTFTAYLETAKLIEAPIIRLWAGVKGSNNCDSAYYKKIVDETALLCDMAKKYDITLAYEFHKGTLADNADSACKIAKDISSSNFGLYFQYSPDFSNEENIKALKKLLPYLKMIHVFNINEKSERLSLDENDGIKLWSDIAAILKANDISVSLLFEFLKESTFEQLKRETTILREILNG